MKHLLLASALIVGSASLSAADPAGDTYAQTHPRIHEINTRLRTQNARIDRAEADGKITAQQATSLHSEDATIKGVEKGDETLDDGHLTKLDQKALNQQLNGVSGQIGGDTHPRIHEVNARLRNQNARIDRAEAVGRISAQQAATLHADDAQIKAAEKTDETSDGGSLTKAAKTALNQLLNKVSTQIFGDTHPRIAEVDSRLHKQDARINRDESEGKITAQEAGTLHTDDASIKSEEQFAAKEDDGHITKAEDRSLNQDISSVGHQISSDAGTTGSHASHDGGSHASHGGHK